MSSLYGHTMNVLREHYQSGTLTLLAGVGERRAARIESHFSQHSPVDSPVDSPVVTLLKHLTRTSWSQQDLDKIESRIESRNCQLLCDNLKWLKGLKNSTSKLRQKLVQYWFDTLIASNCGVGASSDDEERLSPDDIKGNPISLARVKQTWKNIDALAHSTTAGGKSRRNSD